MSLKDAYLDTASHAVALLEAPEVAASWGKASALAEWAVSGLAGHLGYQILNVSNALQEPLSGEEPIPVLEHYARVVWIDEPLDGEVNAGIRVKGEGLAAVGPQELAEQCRTTLAEQRTELPRLPGDRSVFMPWTGWALTLDDLLLTRMMELAVHMDDLAVSVGIATPELPAEAFEPVLDLLTRLSVRRHGQAAMLRALTRAERAPAAINAL